MGERLQRLRRQTGPQPKVAHGIKTIPTYGLNFFRPFFREAADLSKADAQRINSPYVLTLSFVTRINAPVPYQPFPHIKIALSFPPIQFLQRAIPNRNIHVYRTDFNTMLLRITDQLRGGVESHRLAVEQR